MTSKVYLAWSMWVGIAVFVCALKAEGDFEAVALALAGSWLLIAHRL